MRELFINVSGAQTRMEAVRITSLFTHDTFGGTLACCRTYSFADLRGCQQLRSGSKAEMGHVQDQAGDATTHLFLLTHHQLSTTMAPNFAKSTHELIQAMIFSKLHDDRVLKDGDIARTAGCSDRTVRHIRSNLLRIDQRPLERSWPAQDHYSSHDDCLI